MIEPEVRKEFLDGRVQVVRKKWSWAAVLVDGEEVKRYSSIPATVHPNHADMMRMGKAIGYAVGLRDSSDVL